MFKKSSDNEKVHLLGKILISQESSMIISLCLSEKSVTCISISFKLNRFYKVKKYKFQKISICRCVLLYTTSKNTFFFSFYQKYYENSKGKESFKTILTEQNGITIIICLSLKILPLSSQGAREHFRVLLQLTPNNFIQQNGSLLQRTNTSFVLFWVIKLFNLKSNGPGTKYRHYNLQ